MALYIGLKASVCSISTLVLIIISEYRAYVMHLDNIGVETVFVETMLFLKQPLALPGSAKYILPQTKKVGVS